MTAADLPHGADEADLPEQVRVRLGKRQRLLDAGTPPYPVSVGRTHELGEVRAAYAHLGAGEETEDVVGVAGRVMFLRTTGKLCFARLQGGDGEALQVMLSLDSAGADALTAWKTDVDLGDHVFVAGRVVSSRRGELSVLATSWQLAAKTVRPWPVLHKELSEQARVRQRYVDLVVRPAARQMVLQRAAVNHSLRQTFAAHGYVEVETPMLQTLHGGAAARPFVTRSNAFDLDLYLRIAPELFLKRAVVGGLEKVFEINRNFRNEGSDSTHSPEFAMLEWYQAYADYDDMARLTRELVQQAARAATGGSTTVTLQDGSAYDLGGQWADVTLYGSLSRALGEEVSVATGVEELVGYAARAGLAVDPARSGHGHLVERLWEHLVGASLSAPTFVRDFPADTSPLVRQHRSTPGLVEKWDLYVRGFELATGYSELVDPVVQRQRFEQQALLAARGDEEAMALDEDFLTALEHGMPPTGGAGMGIDRLLMAITGVGVRETILFPLVKPEPRQA